MKNKLSKKVRKNLKNGIVNLDNSNGLATHWTAYKKRENEIIYFDSYGNLQPAKEIIKYKYQTLILLLTVCIMIKGRILYYLKGHMKCQVLTITYKHI